MKGCILVGRWYFSWCEGELKQGGTNMYQGGDEFNGAIDLFWRLVNQKVNRSVAIGQAAQQHGWSVNELSAEMNRRQQVRRQSQAKLAERMAYAK